MNKEQVIKHGEVIKWFCDNLDKGVWFKNGVTNRWQIVFNPSFTAFVYVQNDEYSELRKAQADGKVIQHNTSFHLLEDNWGDLENDSLLMNFDSNTDEPKYYRIKPDEPEFKVGDWVEYGIDRWQIASMSTDKSFVYDKDDEFDATIEQLKLWKPKVGEWCVFFNCEDSDFYVIRKHFITTITGDYIPHGSGVQFTNIAPLEFAQTLGNS